ncbi:hypothetical protein HUA76_23930 [Myxococcus sp. CA056]|uniref:hypothetical protein n=1 Tax=unclassified Myxococcus TaxID=2648731 RepID=UPI00157AB1B1|nr:MULTISPECIES: hypothetical protein [unclassified Myxococcus]NTX13860.1 hypothetical protein [Myxococcus sp. CA056]NTX58415.1 hypothetical protein [Myxococcus sp. CA039A]
MKIRSFFPLSRITAAALALSLFAGCNDDDKDPEPTPNTGPVYAAITQVSVDGESQSYIVLTDKVDVTTPLALENAIEVPGRALGSGIAKNGLLYVSSSEGAVVTRYKLTAEGKLEKDKDAQGRDAEVSFQGSGVSSIGEYQHQFQYVSETKAYYIDGRSGKVIVWNPTAMTVTSAITLTGLTIEGALSTFATMPVRVGNKIIIPIGWRPSAGIGITKQAGVVVVDTVADTATIVTDDRCGYVRDGVVGPDGLVYLATEAYGAAVYRTAGPETTPVPCLLRFNATTQTYDRAFFRNLADLTNGNATGSLLRGPNGTAYLRVLDETTYTVVPGVHPRPVASAVAWKFWQLNLSTFTATEVTTLPVSTGSTFLYDVTDSRTLFTEFTSTSTTNFRDLTSQNGAVAFSTQGLVFSFLQLR